MNALLWIVQIALALPSLAGGAYKVFGFDAVATEPFFGALPRGGWTAIGLFEMLCAILLVVPAARRMRVLTPVAAAALALESLALGVLYARYSILLTASNPLVWVVAMGLMAAFVTCGRLRARASAGGGNGRELIPG
jgi:hypothetical protein